MFKFLGVTDDVTTCECCGKKNLKRTIVLDNCGSVVHYGSDCAGKALYGKKSSGNTKEALHKATAVQQATEALAQGYDPEKVAKAVWNRFGYITGVRDGFLTIGTFGKIKIEE